MGKEYLHISIFVFLFYFFVCVCTVISVIICVAIVCTTLGWLPQAIACMWPFSEIIEWQKFTEAWVGYLRGCFAWFNVGGTRWQPRERFIELWLFCFIFTSKCIINALHICSVDRLFIFCFCALGHLEPLAVCTFEQGFKSAFNVLMEQGTIAEYLKDISWHEGQNYEICFPLWWTSKTLYPSPSVITLHIAS